MKFRSAVIAFTTVRTGPANAKFTQADGRLSLVGKDWGTHIHIYEAIGDAITGLEQEGVVVIPAGITYDTKSCFISVQGPSILRYGDGAPANEIGCVPCIAYRYIKKELVNARPDSQAHKKAPMLISNSG